MKRRAFLAAIAGAAVAPVVAKALPVAKTLTPGTPLFVGRFDPLDRYVELRLSARLTDGNKAGFGIRIPWDELITEDVSGAACRHALKKMRRALRNLCDESGATVIGNARLSVSKSWLDLSDDHTDDAEDIARYAERIGEFTLA